MNNPTRDVEAYRTPGLRGFCALPARVEIDTVTLQESCLFSGAAVATTPLLFVHDRWLQCYHEAVRGYRSRACAPPTRPVKALAEQPPNMYMLPFFKGFGFFFFCPWC